MKAKLKTIITLLGILITMIFFHCKKESNSSSPVTETNNSQTVQTDPTKTYKYVSAKSGLKLREETNTKSKVLGLIPFNSQVEVVSETDGEVAIEGKSSTWFQVTFEGLQGFAYGEFLSDTPEFPLLPEQFDSVEFSAMYSNGNHNAKLQIHSDKTVTGENTEYNGCDFIIESGKWTSNQVEKYLRLSTKGYIADSCLTGGKKNKSKLYILKMHRTFDGSERWTCEEGKFNEESAVICNMDK